MTVFPDWPTAFDIPADKLTRYRLDVNGRKPDHARWFISQGFDPTEPTLLASALYRHARRDHPTEVAEDPFGLRFVFEAPLDVAFARQTTVCSVWMCQRGDAWGVPASSPLTRSAVSDQTTERRQASGRRRGFGLRSCSPSPWAARS